MKLLLNNSFLDEFIGEIKAGAAFEEKNVFQISALIFYWPIWLGFLLMRLKRSLLIMPVLF